MSLFVEIIKKRKNTTAPWEVRAIQSVIKQNFLDSPLLLFGTTAIRGGVEQCTSLYIAQRRVLLCKNSPLHGTTDIRVRFEMYSLVHFWTRVFCFAKNSRKVLDVKIVGGTITR